MSEVNLQDYIDEKLGLLPTDGILHPKQAEDRAAKLLQVVAHLAKAKEDLTNAKIKASSVMSVVSEDSMNKIDAKTVTEKKSKAEATSGYISAREHLEIVDSRISYIKTMIEVFNNAHVLYRGMARGEF